MGRDNSANLGPGARHKPKTRINALSMAFLIRALHDGPCSYEDLQEATGLSRITIRAYVKSLQAKKLVREVERGLDSRGAQTIMQFRFEPDKPDIKPTPIPNDIRKARYRARRVDICLHKAVAGQAKFRVRDAHGAYQRPGETK